MATLAGGLAVGPAVPSDSKGRFVTVAAFNTQARQPLFYKLSAIRTSDSVRIYWASATISFNDAPGGGGIYTAGTLTVEGSWTV